MVDDKYRCEHLTILQFETQSEKVSSVNAILISPVVQEQLDLECLLGRDVVLTSALLTEYVMNQPDAFGSTCHSQFHAPEI